MFGHWERSHQPILGLSKTSLVNCSFVQNRLPSVAIAGRIDNCLALSEELQLSNHEALANDNEQLILQAYARWGDRCCEHLLGAYSFVIWDARSAQLFCARDHMGCVPFYYSLMPDSFVFGTCLEDVLAAEPVSQDLDERFVRTQLADKSYVDAERTFYKAVRKLPAGHTLTVTPDRTQLKRYWFPENSPQHDFSTDKECATAFIELLQTVIEQQLPSQSQAGVHLTGGLDSSTVTVMATKVLRSRNEKSPYAYCWLPPPVNDPLPTEHDLIEQVRAQSDISLRFQQLVSKDLIGGLAHDLALLPAAEMLFQEQPVMQQARQDGVRFLLSGWGGDELISFNGRGYYAHLLRSGQWRRLWRDSQAVSSNPLRHIFRQAIAVQYPWVKQACKFIKQGWQRKSPQHYLHPDFVRQVKPYPQKTLRYKDTRQTQLALLNNGHLTERMEAWATVGAKYNLVYRYPLLDKRIVEFALGLPPEMFRRGKWNRWLMRNAASQLLPADVAWNPAKSDPIRMAPLKAGLHEAFSQLGRQLATQQEMPSRAAYLDMPRLLNDLKADSLTCQTSGPRQLAQALLFLNF